MVKEYNWHGVLFEINGIVKKQRIKAFDAELK
jgi:hypothetical protein